MLKDGTGDFKKSEFKLDVKPTPNFGQLMITVHFDLNNEAILKDIRAKKLCFAFHIECPATSYRIEERTYDDSIIDFRKRNQRKIRAPWIYHCQCYGLHL